MQKFHHRFVSNSVKAEAANFARFNLSAQRGVKLGNKEQTMTQLFLIHLINQEAKLGNNLLRGSAKGVTFWFTFTCGLWAPASNKLNCWVESKLTRRGMRIVSNYTRTVKVNIRLKLWSLIIIFRRYLSEILSYSDRQLLKFDCGVNYAWFANVGLW